MNYTISNISKKDKTTTQMMENLLAKEGIKKDPNLDLSIGIFDDLKLIATGSSFQNTLRCLAVDSSYQGQGLMNMLITELLNYQKSQNYNNTFIYTKKESSKFFQDLGFNLISQLENLVFLESKNKGFQTYLQTLKENCSQQQNYDKNKKAGAIILNANPFTLGHQHLIETAAKTCETLHIFIVSQDSSLIPFSTRKKLVEEGTSHIKNIIYHQTKDYIISMATFPSYFLKSEDETITSQAKLDINIFTQIAKELNITKRIVGEEPFSHVTALYNQTMKQYLPTQNINLTIIKRKEENGIAISASNVRMHIKNGEIEQLKNLVPPSTYNYLKSPEAKPIIEKIQNSTQIIHH